MGYFWDENESVEVVEREDFDAVVVQFLNGTLAVG